MEASCLSVLVFGKGDIPESVTRYVNNSCRRAIGASTIPEAGKVLSTGEIDVFIAELRNVGPEADDFAVLLRANPRVYGVAISNASVTSAIKRTLAAGFRVHLVQPNIATGLHVSLLEAAREKKRRASS